MPSWHTVVQHPASTVHTDGYSSFFQPPSEGTGGNWDLNLILIPLDGVIHPGINDDTYETQAVRPSETWHIHADLVLGIHEIR
jgi:hypothetical protein